jgi:hypothetical protein
MEPATWHPNAESCPNNSATWKNYEKLNIIENSGSGNYFWDCIIRDLKKQILPTWPGGLTIGDSSLLSSFDFQWFSPHLPNNMTYNQNSDPPRLPFWQKFYLTEIFHPTDGKAISRSPFAGGPFQEFYEIFLNDLSPWNATEDRIERQIMDDLRANVNRGSRDQILAFREYAAEFPNCTLNGTCPDWSTWFQNCTVSCCVRYARDNNRTAEDAEKLDFLRNNSSSKIIDAAKLEFEEKSKLAMYWESSTGRWDPGPKILTSLTPVDWLERYNAGDFRKNYIKMKFTESTCPIETYEKVSIFFKAEAVTIIDVLWNSLVDSEFTRRFANGPFFSGRSFKDYFNPEDGWIANTVQKLIVANKIFLQVNLTSPTKNYTYTSVGNSTFPQILGFVTCPTLLGECN